MNEIVTQNRSGTTQWGTVHFLILPGGIALVLAALGCSGYTTSGEVSATAKKLQRQLRDVQREIRKRFAEGNRIICGPAPADPLAPGQLEEYNRTQAILKRNGVKSKELYAKARQIESRLAQLGCQPLPEPPKCDKCNGIGMLRHRSAENRPFLLCPDCQGYGNQRQPK